MSSDTEESPEHPKFRGEIHELNYSLEILCSALVMYIVCARDVGYCILCGTMSTAILWGILFYIVPCEVHFIACGGGCTFVLGVLCSVLPVVMYRVACLAQEHIAKCSVSGITNQARA